MRSPFPGMDPYLERHWRDVHGRLIVHASAMLNRQLGEGLRARIDERLVIEHPWGEARSIYPDVFMIERGLGSRPVAVPAGMAVAEPMVIAMPDEFARERFIEIIDPAGRGKVVTVIEFVSPTNKLAGDGREKYRTKQQEVLSADINLVEVDLTRSGRRELAFPEAELPASAVAAYLACVYRGFNTRHFEIYSLPLREKLPAIRIPLRPSDPDAALDLQALVDTAYTEGRHDDIDYTRPIVPPLTGEDADWADRLLRDAGKRPA
jgi:hypothetical protein